jgi:ESS family glutamate:Na+ symporter
LCIAIGIGLQLHQIIDDIGIKLPVFVPCLFGGIILTNTLPVIWKKLPWPTGSSSLALISDFCLGLFLAMSLMSLQLWALVDLAFPILLLLTAQVIMVIFFTIFIVFRALGKNYDAAVIASGYAGLALGATPTAIANMTAVTKKYGASPQAFIVIPLVGAFFIDLSNAFVIQFFISWLS